MTSGSTVVPLRQPEAIEDPLTAILRSGARRLLAQAIEAEADAFLATMKGAQLLDGRDRVVRHGHALRCLSNGFAVETLGNSARSARYRPASVRLRCNGSGCATVVPMG